VMGALGGGVATLGQLHGWIGAALALTAVSFLLQALKLAFPRLSRPVLPQVGGWLTRPLAALLRRPRVALGGYPLGLVLGLLPCGFLYASLLAAAAMGHAVAGALVMASFALGTMPALIAVGVLGSCVVSRWRGFARRLAIPVFVVNAVILGGLAARAVAGPFL